MRRKGIGYLAIALMLWLTPAHAINTVAEGFQVNDGATVSIDAHGNCQDVTNASGVAQFVATKTSTEWSSFRSNLPTGLSLLACTTGGVMVGTIQHRNTVFMEDNTTSATHASNTFTDILPGSLIVCHVAYDVDTVTVSSLTDTISSTYQKASGPIAETGWLAGTSSEVWFAPNTAGGSNVVVTANFSASFTGYRNITCSEYLGASSSPLDGADVDSVVSAAPSTGPITTTTDYDLIYAAGRTQTQLSVGSGFTFRGNANNVQDKTAGVAGAYSAAMVATPSGATTLHMVAFKPGGSIFGSHSFNDATMRGAGGGANAADAFYQDGDNWWGEAQMGENYPNDRHYGLFRFQLSSDIPAGATITNAQLKVYQRGTTNWNAGTDALKIWVQKTSNAPVPTSVTHYPGGSSGTVLSTASTRWPAAGGLTWGASGYITSNSFATPLQEVVDAYYGLLAGDHVQIWVAADTLTNNSRTVGFYDSVNTNVLAPPQLILTFTPPASGGTATKLGLGGPTRIDTGYCSSRYTVTALTAGNADANVTSNTTVSLSSSASGTFYSDSGCTSVITQVTIGSGTSSANFYFKNNTSQTVTLTADDTSPNTLTTATLAGVVSAYIPGTWLGTAGDGLWYTSGNWANNQVPNGITSAIFDHNCTSCNVTINSWSENLGGLHMRSTYTGTITQGTGVVISIFTGVYYGDSPSNYSHFAFLQEGGTFLGSNVALTVDGNFKVNSGTFQFTSSTFDIHHGNITLAAGATITHNSGTIDLYGDGVYNFGGKTVNNINVQSGWGPAVGGPVTLDGNLVLNNGSGNGLYGDQINLKGNLTTGAGGWMRSSVNIKFIGASAQTISGSGSLGGVEVASPGGVTMPSSLTISGSFVVTSGVISGLTTLTMTGDGYGEVDTFNLGAFNLANLVLEKTDQTLDLVGTPTLSGNLTIKGGGSVTGNMQVAGNVTADMCAGCYYSGASSTITLLGNLIGTNYGQGGELNFTFSGTSAQTISRTTGGVFSGTFTVNKASNTLSFASNVAFNGTQPINVTSGTLDLVSYNLTGSPTVTVSSGATLKLQGGQTYTVTSSTFSAGSTVEYNGTGNYSGFNLRTGTAYSGNLSFTGAGGQWRLGATTVGGNLSISAGTVTTNGNNNLTVTGNFTLSGGTYAAGTAGTSTPTIAVAGNFSTAGGTFTRQQSTVNLNGTDQTISGSTTFYRLTKAVTTSRTLTFTAGTTQTVVNTLTLNGAAGQQLLLRSSAGGSQWSINPQGTRTVSYLNIQDGNNTNATALAAGATSTNSGNNTNFTFP